MVEGMAGSVDFHMTEYGHPQQRKVSDTVEDLMAHEFVPEAQPIRINDAVFVYHNRIVQRSTTGQSVTLHIF